MTHLVEARERGHSAKSASACPGGELIHRLLDESRCTRRLRLASQGVGMKLDASFALSTLSSTKMCARKQAGPKARVSFAVSCFPFICGIHTKTRCYN